MTSPRTAAVSQLAKTQWTLDAQIRPNPQATELMPRDAALPRLKYTVVRGRVITIADLPDPKNVRWVKSRKLIVVAAVHAGMLTIEDACARYELSREEFLSWHRAFRLEGLAAQTPASRRL